jgi:hypothetical protein
VADAGFEGYRSIIMVELMLKIAVAENAAIYLVNDKLQQASGVPKNWRSKGMAMCHSTAVPYNAVDMTNTALSRYTLRNRARSIGKSG